MPADANHGGFPGPDRGLNDVSGATIPGQIGYRTKALNDRHPRAHAVGGFVDTGRYADPFFNTAGRNRTLLGGADRTDLQSGIVYVQGQQMVYRRDRSDRGVTLFGGADWAAGGQPSIERMVFGGGFWRGPIGARPRDTAGIAFTDTAVNCRITERIGTGPLDQAVRRVHQPPRPGGERPAQPQRHPCGAGRHAVRDRSRRPNRVAGAGPSAVGTVNLRLGPLLRGPSHR